jgi:WD40 repeat protein
MPTNWKTVRVFISSTFRDMQAERDHLVRFVFPRLREQLLPRRIHLVDVDLRWGVTSEQNALEVCREIINECRPRFLCMLGGRYGWVPPGKTRSITADEVHYGVLDRTLSERGFAYFYFRADEATAAMVETAPGEFRESPGSANESKLAELKQAIIDAKLTPFPYPAQWDNESGRLTGLKQFGDRVYEDLLDSLKSDLELRDHFVTDAAAQPDDFAEENAAMEAFVEERSERFVLGSRATVLEELLAHASATGGNGYVCLTGAPGSGKSALLAHLYRRLTDLVHPSSFIPHPSLVICHFVGASPGSTDVRRTLRRLCQALKAGCADMTADIPDDPEKLRIAFPEFLRQASAQKRVVILLDAVNQFDSASHSAGLRWLPEELPDNACIILSTLDGPALEELRRRRVKPREIELQPLTAADGAAIIEQFRQRYRKQFEPDQRAALLAKTDAGTPLYLLAALEELRTLGTYEEITQRIAELPPTTHELFAWILKRLENDDGFRDALGRRAGRELVPRCAALLGASRYGLSQRELTDLLDTGDPQGNIAALLYLLRPYLLRRAELLDFQHSQFRAAAEEAWLKTDVQRQAANARLVEYFRQQADPEKNQSWRGESGRPLLELPFHLAQYDVDALAVLLCDLRFIEARCRVGQVFELIGDYKLARARLPANQPRVEEFQRFVQEQRHVLQVHPELTFQQAANQAPQTAPCQDAAALWRAGSETRPWLKLVHRQSTFVSASVSIRVANPICAASLATAGNVFALCDGSVCVYEAQTGREIFRLPSHPGNRFTFCALSSDGSLLACAECSETSDNRISLWDVQRQVKVQESQACSCTILAMQFSKAGSLLGFGGGGNDGGVIGVWHIANSAASWSQKVERAVVRKVAFSPDDLFLAAAQGDGHCTFWDTKEGKLKKEIHSHQDSLTGFCFSNQNDLIATTGKDGFCRVWPSNLKSGSSIRLRQAINILFGKKASLFSAHPAIPVSIAFLDETKVISGDTAGNCYLWNWSDGKLLGSPFSTEGALLALETSGDGQLLLAASDRDHTCRIFETKRLVSTGAQEPGQSWYLHFLRDSNELLCAEKGGEIRLLPLAENNLERAQTRLLAKQPNAILMATNANGRFVLVVDRDSSWKLYNVKTSRLLSGRFALPMQGEALVSVKRDGSLVSVCGRETIEFSLVELGENFSQRLPMIFGAMRIGDDGAAQLVGINLRFHDLPPECLMAAEVRQNMPRQAFLSDPFEAEAPRASNSFAYLGNTAFIRSAELPSGQAIVDKWRMEDLSCRGRREFSGPVRIHAVTEDGKWGLISQPEASLCHVVDISSPELEDRWLFPLSEGLVAAAIQSDGDLIALSYKGGGLDIVQRVFQT